MATKLPTEVTGRVWKIIAGPGTAVAEGDTVVIIESMKMEIPVAAPHAGTVKTITVEEGDMVEEGQSVGTIE